MSDSISEQARTDFQRARFKAFVHRVWGALSGQPSTLLSYDEVKEKLHIGRPIYRGVKTEGDLYLWVLDHQRYLMEEGEVLQPPEQAARTFVQDGSKKPSRKTRSDKGKKRKK